MAWSLADLQRCFAEGYLPLCGPPEIQSPLPEAPPPDLPKPPSVPPPGFDSQPPLPRAPPPDRKPPSVPPPPGLDIYSRATTISSNNDAGNPREMTMGQRLTACFGHIFDLQRRVRDLKDQNARLESVSDL